MCGIGGWLGNISDARGVAERMTKMLHHRGPDAHGIQSWPEATLVHTRLSIIDLSAPSQPYQNESGSLTMLCNGEIYNFRELVAELKSLGHTFRTHCDTEVIVRHLE